MAKSSSEIQQQVRNNLEAAHSPQKVTDAVILLHEFLAGMLSAQEAPGRELLNMYTGTRDELKKADRSLPVFTPGDLKSICGEARYAIGLCGRRKMTELPERNAALLRDSFVDLQEVLGYARELLRDVTGIAAAEPDASPMHRQNILPVYYTEGKPDLTRSEREMLRAVDFALEALSVAVPHFQSVTRAQPRVRDVARELEASLTDEKVESLGAALAKVKRAGGYEGEPALFTNGLQEIGGDLEQYISRADNGGTPLRVIAKGMKEMHEEVFAPAFKAITEHHAVAGADAAVDAAGLNRKFLDTLEAMGRGAAHGKG